MGKWYAKFKTGKFRRPRIVCTICTNRFHSPKNGYESLKLVSKMALMFGWNEPKSRVPLTLLPYFPETFCKWWTVRISIWKILTGKTGLTFPPFRHSRKFSTQKTWKVVFYSFCNRIFRKRFVRGEKPIYSLVTGCNVSTGLICIEQFKQSIGVQLGVTFTINNFKKPVSKHKET